MFRYICINSGEEYQDYLAHSAKGTTWKSHRYIKKLDLPSGKTRYIYAEHGKSYQKSSYRRPKTYAESGKSADVSKEQKREMFWDNTENIDSRERIERINFINIRRKEGASGPDAINPNNVTDEKELSPAARKAYRKWKRANKKKIMKNEDYENSLYYR